MDLQIKILFFVYYKFLIHIFPNIVDSVVAIPTPRPR